MPVAVDTLPEWKALAAQAATSGDTHLRALFAAIRDVHRGLASRLARIRLDKHAESQRQSASPYRSRTHQRLRLSSADIANRQHAVYSSRLKRGAVAQLGERRVRNAKVGSSILLRSTNT